MNLYAKLWWLKLYAFDHSHNLSVHMLVYRVGLAPSSSVWNGNFIIVECCNVLKTTEKHKQTFFSTMHKQTLVLIEYGNNSFSDSPCDEE